MKNLDLNAYGVVELTQQEMIAVEGGTWLGDALKKLGKFLIQLGGIIDDFWNDILHAND